MIFNTNITGLDEAAFLIALGFPFEVVSIVETTSLESQHGIKVPSRLSWKFGNISSRGEHVEKYRQWFKLPAPNAPAVHLAQRARLAACNYLALKDALLNQSPLCQKLGKNWSLLKNHEGQMLPKLNQSPGSHWCRTSAAVAIACAFGARLQAFAHIGGLLYSVPAPAEPGSVTPAMIERIYLSSAPADPADYSDFSVMCAMFVMRGELLRASNKNRRLSLHLGSRRALIPADASPKIQDAVFNFLSHGR